jgi:hypothetical protein
MNKDEPEASEGGVIGRVEFLPTPKALWAWAPFGDFYAITINLTCSPHWLARTMCRILLGSKWKKLK